MVVAASYFFHSYVLVLLKKRECYTGLVWEGLFKSSSGRRRGMSAGKLSEIEATTIVRVAHSALSSSSSLKHLASISYSSS